MRILFATAEFKPLVTVGGLGEASAGIVKALRAQGHHVDVVLPDYFAWDFPNAETKPLSLPQWDEPASVRYGTHAQAGSLALVDVPHIVKPAPYVDSDGQGWQENTMRFLAFSAAVAALAKELKADVLHLNDWHTSFAPAFLAEPIPTALTIHNLAYQGQCDSAVLDLLPAKRASYFFGDSGNALAGAIQLADKVVAVSGRYAQEITTEAGGFGLQRLLSERGDDLVGIRNGIDIDVWNPATQKHVPTSYSVDSMDGKAKARAALLSHVGWQETKDPLIVMVSRLVHQKGIDLAFGAARFCEGLGARMIVLGSGERHLADWGRHLQKENLGRFWFRDGYDVALSHQLFAGGDLYLMPSRFEPCGLAQMQAMAYGTLPVVTAVGGLADTVIDADAQPRRGNGFVAGTADEASVVDALHRAVRAHRNTRRRRAITKRGMSADWSWDKPAQQFTELYEDMGI